MQRLDKGLADVRFVDEQQTVLRDERGVDRARFRRDAVAAEEQPRAGLIDCAAKDHRLDE